MPLGHFSFNVLIRSTKVSQVGSKLKKKHIMFLKDLLLMGWALIQLLLWGCILYLGGYFCGT